MPSTVVSAIETVLAPQQTNSLEALVSRDAHSSLAVLAEHLPPILRGGIECRLDADSPQVDIQQCVARQSPELDQLKSFISQAIATGKLVDSSWYRLQDFVVEWSDSSSVLCSWITEIWLEFDIDSAEPIPSIFFGLLQSPTPEEDVYEASCQALDLLLGKGRWESWQSNLYQCFQACPKDVFISHIGVMLSRQMPALRVNIKQLKPESLGACLQQLGWPESTDEVTALMEHLWTWVDQITLCLDVGQLIFPRLGLECILTQQLDPAPRWADLLDDLVKQGLCSLKKRDALLYWPSQITPSSTSVTWPQQLIVESLQRPSHHFTAFHRRISHIKVQWQPNSPLVAKAYLWFHHQWLEGARSK